MTSGGVTVVEVDPPAPGPGEVLVRTALAGVCGSDVHALQGRHPFITLPYPPGHEVSGTIAATGPGVSLAVGTRVTMEPFLPCWACKQCRAGRQNVCENLRFFGCAHDQGGMADFFTVDQRRLHVIPDALDWTTAALIEPLGTPVHAARLAGGLAGKTVAILGAGTIGLLTLQVARAEAAAAVVLTARSARSRERADKFGPDAVVDATAADAVAQVRAALGESADVVFDCVAEQSTTTQALAMANKGGTVVVVGSATGRGHRPAADDPGQPVAHPGQRHLSAGRLHRRDPPAHHGRRRRERDGHLADRSMRPRTPSPTPPPAHTSRSCSTPGSSRNSRGAVGCNRIHLRPARGGLGEPAT